MPDLKYTKDLPEIIKELESRVERLEVSSNTVVFTKSTTGDPSGRAGMIYINTFDNCFKIYADGAWRTIVTW